MNHLLGCWKRRSHICTDKCCRLSGGQAQFQELKLDLLSEGNQTAFFHQKMEGLLTGHPRPRDNQPKAQEVKQYRVAFRF